ncbi:MAG: hypothetical protein ACI4I6_03095 [Hominimerdicola sp.]
MFKKISVFTLALMMICMTSCQSNEESSFTKTSNDSSVAETTTTTQNDSDVVEEVEESTDESDTQVTENDNTSAPTNIYAELDGSEIYNADGIVITQKSVGIDTEKWTIDDVETTKYILRLTLDITNNGDAESPEIIIDKCMINGVEFQKETVFDDSEITANMCVINGVGEYTFDITEDDIQSLLGCRFDGVTDIEYTLSVADEVDWDVYTILKDGIVVKATF